MKYETIKGIEDEKFRRLTGVKKSTFEKMIEILKQADEKKKAKGDGKNKLYLENRLLMGVEYIRENRTYFHVGPKLWDKWKYYIWHDQVDRRYVKHPDFALPWRKALLKSDAEYEVVLIDATENPIERPKKDKNITTQAKKGILWKTQVVVDKQSKQVICTAFRKGKHHNFRLFKESKTHIHESSMTLLMFSYTFFWFVN